MTKTLSFEQYYNKVLGGWAGKCAGGILGAPIEGFKRFNTIPYSDSLFETNFANDDLDLQVLWLDMILKKGSQVRGEDFTNHWVENCDFPWCEYGVANRNIRMGLDNPTTGEHNNWYWKRGMGSPIRSEIWGMVCPGLPARAAFYAGMDSGVDHHGFSVTAEQYLSACAAIAFFENDIPTILTQALGYVPGDSELANMVKQVLAWNDQYEFDIVAAKIKSLYGDADFTSSPMNVAFTILSLLHSGMSFDFLIDALHLGHDSDCVVATAGALLGIILGYDAIPQLWKDRVGNELLVSPGILNIYCPKTLTELSELTCKAGQHFIASEKSIVLTGAPAENVFAVPEKKFSHRVEVVSFPNPVERKDAQIVFHYENLDALSQQVTVKIHSPYFNTVTFSFESIPEKFFTKAFSLCLNDVRFPAFETKIPYTVSISKDNSSGINFAKGFPWYGSWLLMGPFMVDDKSLEPFHPKYADHGLPTQPSVPYMNHDMAHPDIDFLIPEQVEKYLDRQTLFAQSFHTQLISPSAMKMNLKNYFLGMGERTLYLYTEVNANTDGVRWLSMGTSGFLKVWFDGKEVYENKRNIRSFPIAHNVELQIDKGIHKLLVRLDFTLDDFTFEIGLKEHDNKHPHQVLWNTELQFDARNLIEQEAEKKLKADPIFSFVL